MIHSRCKGSGCKEVCITYLSIHHPSQQNPPQDCQYSICRKYDWCKSTSAHLPVSALGSETCLPLWPPPYTMARIPSLLREPSISNHFSWLIVKHLMEITLMAVTNYCIYWTDTGINTDGCDRLLYLLAGYWNWHWQEMVFTLTTRLWWRRVNQWQFTSGRGKVSFPLTSSLPPPPSFKDNHVAIFSICYDRSSHYFHCKKYFVLLITDRYQNIFAKNSWK